MQKKTAFWYAISIVYASFAFMAVVLFFSGFQFMGFYLEANVLIALIGTIIGSQTIILLKKVLNYVF
ncbi:hypothetical protein IBTHAUMO2_380028 [Nitrosopumilaceae archaeon]|nr:hypothetical protein IBTHAUMO2_380028 [Nitrosopumilaceae archaeon]